MNKPVVVIGAGGHAAVLVDILRQLRCPIFGLVSKEPAADHKVFDGIPLYRCDEDITKFDANEVLLVNGIGSMPGNKVREGIQKKFSSAGYQFMTVISPHAVVSDFATLGEGVQVFPNAIVNTNAIVEDGTIINSGAIVEHDCHIGRFNHIAPGATLSGGVSTGINVHIGTGANIIQSISIGSNVLVGAGSTVVINLTDNSKHYVAKPHIVKALLL